MKTQRKNPAMDFAVLILSMCEIDFLPQLQGCKSGSEQDIIESHPLGQYFIEKGYTWKEVNVFISDLHVYQYVDAVKMLYHEPG